MDLRELTDCGLLEFRPRRLTDCGQVTPAQLEALMSWHGKRCRLWPCARSGLSELVETISCV
eukprot:1025325-Rhodomonas_salina.1